MRLVALSAEQCAVLVRPPLAAVAAVAAVVGASVALAAGEGVLGGAAWRVWVREVGPFAAALVAAVRLGPALAGELASMRATLQIDALRTLAGSLARHLVAPRVAAAAVALPLLAGIADAAGLAAAAGIAIGLRGLPADAVARGVLGSVLLRDAAMGLARASLFGVVFAAVACSEGLAARGTVRSVGDAAARASARAALAVLGAEVLMRVVGGLG